MGQLAVNQWNCIYQAIHKISVRYALNTRDDIRDVVCLKLTYKQESINKLGINSGINSA